MYVLSIEENGYREYYAHFELTALLLANFWNVYPTDVKISKTTHNGSLEVARGIIACGEDNWSNFEKHFKLMKPQEIDFSDEQLSNVLIDLHEMEVEFDVEGHTITIVDQEVLQVREIFHLVDTYGLK